MKLKLPLISKKFKNSYMFLFLILISKKFKNSYMFLFLISLIIDGIWIIPALLIHFNGSQLWLWLLYVPVMIISYYALVYIKNLLKKKHGE